MIPIQTRDEFTAWVRRNFSGVDTEPNSPLWIPEHDLEHPCQWFWHGRCIGTSKDIRFKLDYWLWCSENLSGHVRCFYSDTDSDQEGWGFTDQSDISWWMLKWAQ